MKQKTTAIFSKRNFDTYMRRQWAKKKFKLRYGERVGVPVSDLISHSVRRNKAIKMPFLELWIAILDEFISWQIGLATIFYSQRKEGRFTNFDRSITMVLMKIISDSIAMRHLMLLGYDVSARTLLRSTAEYAELFVAILDDPSLADEFVKTDTPGEANKFWKKHIARGSLQKKMMQAWTTWFRGKEPSTAAWFSSWGRQSYGMLSAMIHPSLAGGVFAAIPFKTKHTSEKWLGIWGDKSDGSVDTIYIYAAYMFPVFLLHDDFPFTGFDGHMGNPIIFDESDELHRHVKEGRSILASLVLSLGKRSNRKHIFPKYDMSPFRRRGRI